jgi:hypothetical protein
VLQRLRIVRLAVADRAEIPHIAHRKNVFPEGEEIRLVAAFP